MIVLKALEKGPQERYWSVDALAADIRRYLNGRVYVDETPGDRQLDPVWYKYIGPPTASDWGIAASLRESYGSAPRERGVHLALLVDGPVKGGVSIVIDEKGREVPGTRKTSDDYKRNRDKLPDPNWIQLLDLPPINKAADDLQDS